MFHYRKLPQVILMGLAVCAAQPGRAALIESDWSDGSGHNGALIFNNGRLNFVSSNPTGGYASRGWQRRVSLDFSWTLEAKVHISSSLVDSSIGFFMFNSGAIETIDLGLVRTPLQAFVGISTWSPYTYGGYGLPIAGDEAVLRLSYNARHPSVQSLYELPTGEIWGYGSVFNSNPQAGNFLYVSLSADAAGKVGIGEMYLEDISVTPEPELTVLLSLIPLFRRIRP